jgi:hypothetical protein
MLMVSPVAVLARATTASTDPPLEGVYSVRLDYKAER